MQESIVCFMKLTRLNSALLFLFVICFIGGCRTVAPIKLTSEQQAIIIAPGNQATTLKLVNTHISVATEEVASEFKARERAVALSADVAQLISQSSYNGITNSSTYRFWRKK